MRVKLIETPELTGKIWDNELFRLTDNRRGDCHSEIMDNIKVGDKHINGVGHEFVCIRTHVTKEDMLPYLNGRELGQNWLVVCHPLKKDGTVHRGVASNEFEHTFYSWESK
jgi:hypothetical protein|tara:strand:+ start:231 stop:563 length:333 start_codon:yes stop_codon:yes gene_type:complete